MTALDALYFSVETVATVGYGDFTFVDQSPWLRWWAILLMLAGITTIALLMAFLADLAAWFLQVIADLANGSALVSVLPLAPGEDDLMPVLMAGSASDILLTAPA